MKKSDYLFKSFISAGGVFIYVSAIAWLGFNSQTIFGKDGDIGFLLPVFTLLLFVISALVTGLLVLGKPIHLYLSGAKKEAFILLFTTLVWLVLLLLIVAVVIMLGHLIGF